MVEWSEATAERPTWNSRPADLELKRCGQQQKEHLLKVEDVSRLASCMCIAHGTGQRASSLKPRVRV